MPGSAFPKTTWLDSINFDKLVHYGLFFVWVTLFSINGIINREIKIRQTFIFTIFAILYGVGMEYIQKAFIPNRSFDPGDIYANTSGAMFAFFVILYLYRSDVRRKRRLQ